METVVLHAEVLYVEVMGQDMSHVEAVMWPMPHISRPAVVMRMEVTPQASAKENVAAIAQAGVKARGPHSVEMTPTQAAAKENVPAIAQAGKVQGATPAQAEAKENVSVVAEAGVRAQGAMPQRVMKVMIKVSATAG